MRDLVGLNASVRTMNMTLAGAPQSASGLVTTGLTLWLDANDITTLWQDSTFTTQVTADTQSVAGWQDKSGSARHVNQPAAATNYPTYRTNITGGKPAILFDGVDDYLQAVGANLLSITNGATGFTIMSAVRFGVGAGTTVPVFFASTDSGAATVRVQTERASASNLTRTAARRANADAIATTTPNANPGDNTWVAMTNVVNLPSDSIAVYNNTTSTGTASLVAGGGAWPSANSLAVNIGKTGGLSFMNGYIAEIVAYARVLSTAEINQNVAYLRAKWGF